MFASCFLETISYPKQPDTVYAMRIIIID